MLAGVRNRTARAFALSLGVSVVACTQIGGRPPWWDDTPVDPKLFCAGDRPPRPAKTASPSHRAPARDSKVVEARLHAQSRALRACYEHALVGSFNAAGRVDTRILVGAAGDVTHACLERAQGFDSQSLMCMLGVFRATRFGAAGGEFTVVYPVRYVRIDDPSGPVGD